MKRLFMVVAALCLTATIAHADHIGIFAEPAGFDCTLNELVPFPTTTPAYIVHKFNAGSAASQFKVVNATPLFFASATSPYLFLGYLFTDISFSYGGCVTGDHVLMTLAFFYFGAPTTCESTLAVVAAPTSPLPGEIITVTCGPPFDPEAASGGRAYVGPESDACPCICQCPHPVRETTWGGVKALYR